MVLTNSTFCSKCFGKYAELRQFDGNLAIDGHFADIEKIMLEISFQIAFFGVRLWGMFDR